MMEQHEALGQALRPLNYIRSIRISARTKLTCIIYRTYARRSILNKLGKLLRALTNILPVKTHGKGRLCVRSNI